MEACNKERAKVFEVAKTGAFSAEYIKCETDKIDNRELALKTQLSEVKIEEYDIETVINEGINFMRNPSATWKKSLIDTKQRIQKMVFPEGFYFDAETGFGTSRLSSPFAFCEALASAENHLVNLALEEWNALVESLIRISNKVEQLAANRFSAQPRFTFSSI